MPQCPRIFLSALWAAVLAGVVCAAPPRAQAGGLYITDRGTRQLGRGGAFVAGTDDGQSLWYNPAGMGFSGNLLHVDGTLTLLRGSFTRITRDDINNQDGVHPTVEGDTAPLPVPTLALHHDFGLEDFTFGAALMAPNASILSWPDNLGVDDNGMAIPAPQRYSLISMEGSALANLALGGAWHGVDGLSIGAGVHIIPARFRAALTMTACDYGTLCQNPEDPDWDARAVVDLERAVAFTGVFGAIYDAGIVRIGASVMLPYTLSGDAKLDVELPNAPLFDGAEIQGDKAELELDFPMVVRAGIELQPMDPLRLEVGVTYEGWSRQEEMRVEPKGVTIVDAVGIPEYEVGSVAVPRDMEDVFSLRFGGEYRLPVEKLPIAVRGGVIVENGAFPSETLTPLTLDSDKVVLGLGASVKLIDAVWLDVVYGHIFMRNLTVDNSRVFPQNPIRPPYQEPEPGEPDQQLARPEPIGNGRYAMEADFVGLGLRWQLDEG